MRRRRRAPGNPPGCGKAKSSSRQEVERKLRESLAGPRLLLEGISIFLVELVRFLGETLVQLLVVGLLTAVGDHVLKPVLAATFSSLLQPVLLFLHNILRATRDLLDPLLQLLGTICSQLALLLSSPRLVEIHLWPDPSRGRRGGKWTFFWRKRR